MSATSSTGPAAAGGGGGPVYMLEGNAAMHGAQKEASSTLYASTVGDESTIEETSFAAMAARTNSTAVAAQTKAKTKVTVRKKANATYPFVALV